MQRSGSNYSTMERRQYLQFVVAWLDAQRCQLSARTHHRLRQTARRQLGALRTKQQRAANASTTAARRELALVTAVRAALASWVAAGALTMAAAQRLDRQLGRHSEDLKLELAGDCTANSSASLLDALDYALECLPQWSQQAGLKPDERQGLAVFLRSQRALVLMRLAEYK